MKQERRHRKQKPLRDRPIALRIFVGVVALALVFGGLWLINLYKIRKTVEAANAQYHSTYGAAEESTVSEEQMNRQLQAAGLTMDDDGNISMPGVDMDAMLKMMESMGMKAGFDESSLDPDSVPEIESTRSEDGTVTYRVNGTEISDRPHLFNFKEVVYNGVHYKRNTAVKAWLILGVDNKGSLQIDRDISEIGLSDGIFLVAEDTSKNKVHIIQIPRDTMTTITVTDDNSDPIGERVDHITRAWMYGDNHAKSGKYAMDAVSGVMGGLPINGYMAGSIDVIKLLNDYIGGVEVTVEEDGLEKADPAFIKGETVLLEGDMAEKYLRARDKSIDFTAMTRMDRHRQYAVAFENKLLKLQKRNSDTIPGMFDLIEDNIMTDMSKGTYLKIAMDVAVKDGALTENDFSTFEGRNVVNEAEQLDEFWPDYTQLDKLTLDYFYRQI